MTAEERKRHMEEGLCYKKCHKCHKKGHRLFQCHELMAKHLWKYHSPKSNDGGKAILPAIWSSRLHLLFVLRH
jgi:hypothetical protein